MGMLVQIKKYVTDFNTKVSGLSADCKAGLPHTNIVEAKCNINRSNMSKPGDKKEETIERIIGIRGIRKKYSL